MRYGKFLFIFILMVLVFSVQVLASEVIHGEIAELFLEQAKIKVLINGKMDILLLDDEIEVYRNGQLVQVRSARPITEDKYQEGIFFLNEQGLVQVMLIDYFVEERKLEGENKMIYYDIFGNVKEVEQLSSVLKEFTY